MQSEVGLPTALIVDKTEFTNNTAGGHDIDTREYLRGDPNSGGGALSVQGFGAELNCTSSTFQWNKAGTGGAISGTKSSSLRIWDPILFENSANQGGGVGFVNGKKLMVIRGNVTGNYAREGGGMYLTGSDFGNAGDFELAKREIEEATENAIVSIYHTNFSKNTAHQGGGGLDIIALSFVCVDCDLDSNYVDGDDHPQNQRGGAIKMTGRSLVVIHNANITSSSAQIGGGISAENAVLVAHNMFMRNNSATEYGGAVEIEIRPEFNVNEIRLAEFHDCTIEDNRARTAGEIEHSPVGELNTKSML